MLVLAMLFSVFPSVAPLDTSTSWSVQTLSDYATRDSGRVAIDSKDNPHVVYHIRDLTNLSLSEAFYELKYGSWDGSSWNISTAFQYALVLDFVLDSNDNPHLLYRKSEERDNLSYAKLTEGKGWVSQTIDSNDGGVSLALDSADTPHVAYFAGAQLKYASYNGTSWDIRLVDPPEPLEGPLTTRIILEIDQNDIAHIMYTTGDSHINYIVGDGVNWNVLTFFEGYKLKDMVLDSKGYPHIAYLDNAGASIRRQRYARWNGNSWDSQNFQVPEFDYGGYYMDAKIAIDSRDRPHISYSIEITGSSGNLMYASLRGNEWEFQSIDPENAYWAGSIAVDSNNNPHVLYFSFEGQPRHYKTGYFINYATADLPEVSETVSDSPLLLIPAAVTAGVV
ncbi:MAG: hypothetical protein CW691_00005, partial [Candidatus Bathyarchaeum sp.]